MSTTPSPAQITLGTYGRMVVRRWKALVIGVLVGIFIAAGLFVTAPKAYTARTAVLVRPTVIDGTQLAGGRTSSVLNLDTEAQILRSSLVATRAAAILESAEDPLDLVRQVTVSVPPNTSVLDVNFTAGTPVEAQRGTTAFAQAYLDNRASTAQAVVDADVAEIDVAIQGLDVRLSDLAVQLTLLPVGSPDRVILEGDRQLVLQSKGRLQEQLDALIGGAVTGGEVLTEPRLPVNPSAPNRRLYFVGGVLAGLLLGLGLALLAERRNRRVWRADEITDLHELPQLAEIDLVGTSDGRLTGTGSAPTELSHLANTIRATAPPNGSTTAVVGASVGDSAGWVAAKLAYTLSRSGDRVALVSASPGQAMSTAALDVSPPIGLGEVLTGAATVDEVIVGVDGAPSLTVVGVGGEGRLGSEWLNSAPMHDLVIDLDERNTFVVLDAAAVPVSGDAQAMASLASNAIIIVELGVTTPDELAAAVRAIDAVGTPLLGVVAVSQRTARFWHRKRATKSSPALPAVSETDAAARRDVRSSRVPPPTAVPDPIELGDDSDDEIWVARGTGTAASDGRRRRDASSPRNLPR